MTNHYCESWNLIGELTEDQVEWLLKFREALSSRGDYEPVPDQFSGPVDDYLLGVGYDEEESEMYCTVADHMNFDVERGHEFPDTSVVIGYSEAFTPDHAAEFLRIFLNHFLLERHIILEWAGYPSRPITGAYYGGAALVTPDEVYWFIPGALADDKSSELREELEKES